MPWTLLGLKAVGLSLYLALIKPLFSRSSYLQNANSMENELTTIIDMQHQISIQGENLLNLDFHALDLIFNNI